METDPEPLPRVAESILKKRRRNLAEKARQDAIKARKRRGKAYAKKTFFFRAERLTKINKLQERSNLRLQREESKPKKCRVKPRGDLAFVLRIREDRDVPANIKQVLSLLRLKAVNQGVFLRLNETTLALLQIVDPYVTWGHPNLRTVKDLIYKRGKGKVKGSMVPLTDNTLIENALGQYDILCLEDLVHEIFSPDTEHFREANDFLHSFYLNKPIDNWKNKAKPYKDGGDYGMRHDDINKLLRTLL